MKFFALFLDAHMSDDNACPVCMPEIYDISIAFILKHISSRLDIRARAAEGDIPGSRRGDMHELKFGVGARLRKRLYDGRRMAKRPRPPGHASARQ